MKVTITDLVTFATATVEETEIFSLLLVWFRDEMSLISDVAIASLELESRIRNNESFGELEEFLQVNVHE